MASNLSVNVLAPMRLRCALSFEKSISMGLRSGLYGGRKRNQHPASCIALAAAAFLWVARLSRMTTVAGWLLLTPPAILTQAKSEPPGQTVPHCTAFRSAAGSVVLRSTCKGRFKFRFTATRAMFKNKFRASRRGQTANKKVPLLATHENGGTIFPRNSLISLIMGGALVPAAESNHRYEDFQTEARS